MFKIISVLALIPALFSAQDAQAHVPGTCGMEFNIRIVDPILDLRYTGRGTGKITCTDLEGQHHSSNIVIDVVGYGLGAGEYTLNGVSGDINVASARELEGDFGGIALQMFVLNAQVGFTGKQSGLKFGVQLSGNESGVGLFVGATTWRIRLAR